MPTITRTIEEFDHPERVRALAEFAGVRWTEVETDPYDRDKYCASGNVFAVMTESEAAQEFSDRMGDYIIDEIIMPDVPENLRCYFDAESFMRDVLRSDGRGPTLAHYDGEENESWDPVTREYFLIYRTN